MRFSVSRPSASSGSGGDDRLEDESVIGAVARVVWTASAGVDILVLTIVDESDLAGASTVVLAMAATVGLGIYAHGITAWWGFNRYADWYESRRAHHAEMPDGADLSEVRHRVRSAVGSFGSLTTDQE